MDTHDDRAVNQARLPMPQDLLIIIEKSLRDAGAISYRMCQTIIGLQNRVKELEAELAKAKKVE